MRDIIGKYNRNRKIIWFIVGIIIATLSLIYIINNDFKEEHFMSQNKDNKVIIDKFYDTNYSVISSQSISSSTSDEVIDVIKQFINYCNEGDVESAYNMLSTDCKEVLYSTVEKFHKNYYENNFHERKTYNIQAWSIDDTKYTYLVELKEDILTTGQASNKNKQEYYTVIEENDNYYLNINGFIEKNIINSLNENNSIEIIINSEEVFVDYLNLNITVNNKTKNNVLLDSGKRVDSAFITDSKGIPYISYLYETKDEDLLIQNEESKMLKIKFMKNYKPGRNIKTVNFNDVILNYQGDKSERLEIVVVL